MLYRPLGSRFTFSAHPCPMITKSLADLIEAKVFGKKTLFEVDKHIDELSSYYASLIKHRHISIGDIDQEEKEDTKYEAVNLKSISNSKTRRIGAEYEGLSMFRLLGLDGLFKRLGFSDKEIDLAILSIVGRLVYPASERRTRVWAKHISGIDELLGTDFSHLSNNALYRILDFQLSHKEKIEEHLRLKERNLFSLRENIILYDLTNTYFEGEAKTNKKAKRGRSKEKRTDCPLVTLGMVIDEMGFPKKSKIFKDNISEPDSLKVMIEDLQGSEQWRSSKKTKKVLRW